MFLLPLQENSTALPAAKPAALCSSLFCIAQLKPKPLPPLPNIFEPVTFWGNTEYLMNWVFGSFYVNCYRCYRFKDRCPSGRMSPRFRYDITNAESWEGLYSTADSMVCSLHKDEDN